MTNRDWMKIVKGQKPTNPKEKMNYVKHNVQNVERLQKIGK